MRINEVYDFSIKYRYSDILLKRHNLHKNNRCLFCCNRTCYWVGMVFVTSASRTVTSMSRYQSRSSMYIRGLIPRNFTKLAEIDLIGSNHEKKKESYKLAVIIIGTIISVTII